MENRRFELKDGRKVALRLLKISDRNQLLDLFSIMSDKALEWGMPPYLEETIDRWISNIERLIPLVAICQGQIVGYAAIFKHIHPREKGVSDLGIYLHQDFHNIGLGTIMTETLLSFAEEHGLHRIGLHVVEDNRIAVNLYRKLGFTIEGTMVDAYFGMDEKYHNMIVMGLLLPRK